MARHRRRPGGWCQLVAAFEVEVDVVPDVDEPDVDEPPAAGALVAGEEVEAVLPVVEVPDVDPAVSLGAPDRPEPFVVDRASLR